MFVRTSRRGSKGRPAKGATKSNSRKGAKKVEKVKEPLEQRHLDLIGLGCVLLGIYLVFVLYFGWDGGRLGSGLRDGLQYMIGLERAGILFASGPLGVGDGAAIGDGLTILNVDSLEHARTLAAIDPFVRSGARTFSVREWTLMEGRINVSLSFSSKSLEVD